MIAFPPGKINLGLDILSKREDGYHNISTCFYPLPFTDILEVIPSALLQFTASGISIPGDDKENLCLRAFRLVHKRHGIGNVSIHLHKVIPTGAGLGGGSSDAAHTLLLLNYIFDLKLTTAELTELAAELGSDCAFFIYDIPMMGEGRGEVLSPISLSLEGKYLLLAHPKIHVGTTEAYQSITPVIPHNRIQNILAEQPIETWHTLLKNDFEASVFPKHDQIKSLKEAMYEAGAQYASMSGSGSSVFGIFNSPPTVFRFDSLIIWKGFL